MGSLEQDLNLVRKITWSYIKTQAHLTLEFDDLFSEACIAYLEAEKKFDPKKGSKSTFMWYVISNKLNNLIKQKNNIQFNETNDFEEIVIGNHSNPSPEQILVAEENVIEFILTLSSPAQNICKILLNPPEGLFLPSNPKKCRGVLVKYLRENQGWAWNNIWSAFKEIKIGVKTIFHNENKSIDRTKIPMMFL